MNIMSILAFRIQWALFWANPFYSCIHNVQVVLTMSMFCNMYRVVLFPRHVTVILALTTLVASYTFVDGFFLWDGMSVRSMYTYHNHS